MTPPPCASFPENQNAAADRVCSKHRDNLDLYWDENGRFREGKDGIAPGGFRAALWHCLAYLGGDDACRARANRIIDAQKRTTLCHFAPGACIEALHFYRDALEPESVSIFERYLDAILSQFTTEDLKIHGYNDNHPYKAAHALILGGEMLGDARLVGVGLHRLRQAVEVFQRSGFPCEYNSPNYAPVSLQPLAGIVERAQNDEARDLALRLERFYWQDVALHFDPRPGVPTGPMSRAGANDYSGLLGGALCLLHYLFPERFALDLLEEVYDRPERNPHITDVNVGAVSPRSFYQAHLVWYAHARYHLTPELVDALFERPAGACVRGFSESGTWALEWPDAAMRPNGAPDRVVFGPRRSLLTTYFGDSWSLGTSQVSWLDNAQAHGFYATLARGLDGDAVRGPANASVYFCRYFADDDYPYGEQAKPTGCFRDAGFIRTVHHRNTAMVFYQPIPKQSRVRRLRTGVFRPLWFSQPKEIWVGDEHVANGRTFVSDALQPIAIHEGRQYVGVVPLPLSAGSEQSRKAVLQVQSLQEHLSILISSRETWQPEELSYQTLMETFGGFVFEIHSASDFESFENFRHWLAEARVEDDYYALMRTTTYEREGVTLSASYSPYESAFRYASINNAAVGSPVFQITGQTDPGYALALPENGP